jgi:hypothetical protein
VTEGLTPELALAAFTVFVAGTLLLLRRLGPAAACTVMGLKVALSLAYFAALDSGGWRLLDDVTYAERSAELLAAGIGPVEALTDPDAFARLIGIAKGHHFGYFVYNLAAQALFGDHYWSAVFLNGLVTCAAGLLFFRILGQIGLARAYHRAATVFLLLHWDLLAWSALLNVKDSVVLALTLWLFTAGYDLILARRWTALVHVVAASGLLFFFRWYVPVLFAAALGAWALTVLRGRRRLILLVLAALAGAAVWRARPPLDLVTTATLAPGMLRYYFTPRPWGLQPSYTFLLLPATLHWLLTPVAARGALLLWRGLPRSRPLLLYLVVLMGFYALVPHLQGPRHRYQAVFVIALIQFYGALSVMRAAVDRRPRLTAAAAGAELSLR